MRQRVNKICYESYVNEGINDLLKIFKENGYPKGMLNKLLFSSHDAGNQLQSNVNTTEHTHYPSYPNINNLTGKLRNIFKDENVKIAVRNQKTVRNLYSRLKDPIPTLLKSNVVYEIECKDCDKKYIGQTSQWLKSRITLHKSDTRKHHERCALSTHAFTLDHRVNYEDVNVLQMERNYRKRLILEMIEINKQDNVINKKTDTNKLSTIYKYLLEKTKRENSIFFDGPVDE